MRNLEQFLTHKKSQVREVAKILSNLNLNLDAALRCFICDRTEEDKPRFSDPDGPVWSFHFIWTNDIRFNVSVFTKKPACSTNYSLNYVNYLTDDSFSSDCSRFEEFKKVLTLFILPFIEKYCK